MLLNILFYGIVHNLKEKSIILTPKPMLFALRRCVAVCVNKAKKKPLLMMNSFSVYKKQPVAWTKPQTIKANQHTASGVHQ